MVPNNIIVPYLGVSFDSSNATAGVGEMPVKGLLFGQKLDAATGETKKQILVTSADEVAALAGYGSTLHRGAIVFFKNNQSSTLYIIMLDDADTATAAVTNITITGAATVPGELAVYVDGDRYAVGVTALDDAEAVALATVAAINARLEAPVVATSAVGVVTLTAKNAGVAAGDVDVRLSYNAGEILPAGLTVAISATTPGTVDADVQDVLDAMGDTWFNAMGGIYTDSTSLGKIEDFLTNTAGPLTQRDAMYYFGKKGTRSELITFATDGQRNNPYMAMLATSYMPATSFEVVAANLARVLESITEDVAVPLHRQTLLGLLPVAETERWTLTERNQLAENGISTLTQDLGVQLEATVTMYLKNAAGAADIAYQQQNTIYQLMYSRYTFVNYILVKYPRAKLADNIDRMESGQQVITPKIGKAEAVAWFRELERQGILENIDQFKDDVVCQRSTTNPNRLEWLLPPDLVNQFIVGSATMQFRLQS